MNKSLKLLKIVSGYFCCFKNEFLFDILKFYSFVQFLQTNTLKIAFFNIIILLS